MVQGTPVYPLLPTKMGSTLSFSLAWLQLCVHAFALAAARALIVSIGDLASHHF